MSQVDTLLEQDLGKWQAITYMIARRIAIIERECWDADPTSVPLEDEQPLNEWSDLQHQGHIQEQIKASGHRVVRVGNYVVCTKCGKRTAWKDTQGETRDKAIKYWTSGMCKPTTTKVTLAKFGVHAPQPKTRLKRKTSTASGSGLVYQDRDSCCLRFQASDPN